MGREREGYCHVCCPAAAAGLKKSSDPVNIFLKFKQFPVKVLYASVQYNGYCTEAYLFCRRKEFLSMGERSGTVREVRKRRRRRQRRRAWAVVTALFLCIMAADFLGGFLVGCSWQKSTGRELLPEIFAADTEGGPVAGT